MTKEKIEGNSQEAMEQDVSIETEKSISEIRNDIIPDLASLLESRLAGVLKKNLDITDEKAEELAKDQLKMIYGNPAIVDEFIEKVEDKTLETKKLVAEVAKIIARDVIEFEKSISIEEGGESIEEGGLKSWVDEYRNFDELKYKRNESLNEEDFNERLKKSTKFLNNVLREVGQDIKERLKVKDNQIIKDYLFKKLVGVEGGQVPDSVVVGAVQSWLKEYGYRIDDVQGSESGIIANAIYTKRKDEIEKYFENSEKNK